ncbi:MAG: hypothetical protein IPN71_18505 [Fibrobacteres bacterium]|nr:hypothetical protein [Fibrobacterota bacterium]
MSYSQPLTTSQMVMKLTWLEQTRESIPGGKISDRFFGLQIGPTVPVTYWFHLYAVAEFNWAAEFRKPVYDKNHNHLGYFYPFHQGSIGYEMGTQLHLFRAHLSAGWNSASRGVSLSLGFVNWL